ncbi:MAG: BCD family MFS transporter [Pseudomonadota bacterium]
MTNEQVEQVRRAFRQLLPFADAASKELPLKRLLRLSLFQVSVGMAIVLLTGTLNRVMIVELGISAWIVGAMIAIPLISAPFRVLMGFRSDQHRSFLGWRRVPYIAFGTMLQFGGLAIMPFALILLSGDNTAGPEWLGPVAAAAAFLMTGTGVHMAQTAGLALAADLAPEDARPRVVALLYVMLLVGMVISALSYGIMLADFDKVRLIQVIQGTAVVTLILNHVALWKQEPRNPELTKHGRPRISFADSWARFRSNPTSARLLVALGLGTAAFSMQDILLEPYGGEILGMSVGQTTALTALLAGGTLGGFFLAAMFLARGAEPHRLAAWGVLTGVPAFSAIIFAAPLQSAAVFCFGTTLIGLGGGLFAVGTMTAAMALAQRGQSGLALGAWGAVQATAAGGAIALGSAVRDVVARLTSDGQLGPALATPEIGYSVVYHLEIGLLFATLAVIGPLAKHASDPATQNQKLGLSQFPS